MKKIPHWLRGAIVFGVIFIPLFLVNENNQFFFIPWIVLIYALGYSFVSASIHNLFPATIVTTDGITTTQAGTGIGLIAEILIIFIFYIIAGALIGWLYGSIKRKIYQR